MRPVLTVSAALVVLAVLVVGQPTAGAQDDGFASVKIDVIGSVPWDDGQRVDARVNLTTERAISGTLSVVDSPEGRSTTTYEFDVDLAADASAVFPVTLTTGWEGLAATAVVRSNGDVVA
ncbi:MAG: hypothetical protein ACR2QK_13990, partial [Acidimicrobiales bacterium]